MKRALLLRASSLRLPGRRCLSSVDFSEDAFELMDRLVIPVRHSLRSPPPTCRDRVELQALTDELLQDDNWAETASGWDYVRTQKAEYVVRGHAALVPGTQWQRWWKVPHDSSLDPSIPIQAMQDVLQQLTKQGDVFMELRRRKLQQQAQALVAEPHNDLEFSAEEDELVDDGSDWDTDSDSEEGEDTVQAYSSSSDDEDPQDDDDDYVHPFAPPGPTVAMYDTVLDALAVTPQGTPSLAGSYFQDILDRHNLDGGDEHNTNVYTKPTLVSFNATLRIVANTTTPHDRDEAIAIAFSVYDALTHSKGFKRNSATFQYMLTVVANLLPPSRSRGNIAHGMLQLAGEVGVVDDAVIQAYQKANQPTNGPEFETWIQQELPKLPQSWRQFYKTLRYNRREGTY